MPYREWTVPGAVQWESWSGPSPTPMLILPDGCLDLIWDGERLFVAGPDTAAQRFQGRPGTHTVALRFRDGLGPALLGVPADALTDRRVDLDQVWSAAAARR